MVRRRMRRIELARPTRDAVDVRESTWFLISLLSRTAACWAACAALCCARHSRYWAGAARIRSWRRERSFGSLDRLPSLRNDTGIITENRCSVKWSAFRPPRGQASCPGTPAVQSDGPRHRMGRPAFRLIPRAVEWVAGRSTRRSGGAPSVVRNAGRSRAGRASGVLAGRSGRREARAAPAVGSMDEPTSERSWPHRPFGPVCKPNVDRNRPQPTDGSLGEPFSARRPTRPPVGSLNEPDARDNRPLTHCEPDGSFGLLSQ